MAMAYQPTIGLEVHAELKTQTKMFCDSLNDSLEKHPNLNVCPICLGHPGVLPVINKKAVENVLKVGLALNAQIAAHAKFDRKNYFYPDLPKGYQISQYDLPLCLGGHLEIEDPEHRRRIKIRRVHLEEDTGKLIHETRNMKHETASSFIDFNRAGIPLMELVTEPALSSGEEAQKFAEELQLILRYLGVSDADMEKGQMRVEVNISLQREMPNDKTKIPNKLGTKVEIKNLNSFKAVREAVEYEIKRQSEILEAGGKITQETRGWDENERKTFSQRSKEEAHDYRYFPEPDLPFLEFSPSEIEKIKLEIPELPSQKRERFKKEFALPESDIEVLIKDRGLAKFFEETASELGNPQLYKLAVNYLISDLGNLLKDSLTPISEIFITAEKFAELITLISEEKISSRVAKDVLKEMFLTGKDPHQIIEEKNLGQISDQKELEKIVQEILEKNPEAMADFKKGKTNALQFLAGQILKQTQGRANPKMIQEILIKKLT